MKLDLPVDDWKLIRIVSKEAMDPRKWLVGGLAMSLAFLSFGVTLRLREVWGGISPWIWFFPGLVLWGSIQGAFCVIARMTALRMAHGGVPDVGSCVDFARRHARTLFMAPFPFLVLAGLPLAVVSILGLLGNIPYLGGILLAIFVLPAVSLAFVSVLIAIVWICTTLFVPSIVAVEGSDVLDVCGKAIHLALSNTWPLLKTLLIWFVFSIPFTLFVDGSLWLATGIGLRVLGRPVVLSYPGWDSVLLAATGHCGWLEILWGLSGEGGTSSIWGEAGGFILSIALWLLLMTGLGVPLSFLGIGTTLSYTVCRFRTDGISPRTIVEDADELLKGEGPFSSDLPKGG